MEGKHVSFSAIQDQLIELLCSDFTPQGTLHGGKVLQIADDLALLVSKRHSGLCCSSIGIDSLRFINPARRGDMLICKAAVNRTWNHCMEVGVKLVSENFRTLEQKDILSAYFTVAALDCDLTPLSIVPVIPESPDEWRRYDEAEERRQLRLKQNIP